MSRWFRLYEELLDDPKVQRLPAEDFKAYINLLCLASRHDGVLPDMDAISFALRLPSNGALTVVSRLKDAGLIVTRNGGANGSHNAINGWNKRQFKSDGSTDRVKRFRERSKGSCETEDETPPESETEREKERAGARDSLDSRKEKNGKLVILFEIEGEEPVMSGVRRELADALGDFKYAPFCDKARPVLFKQEGERLIARCCDGLAYSLAHDHEHRLSMIAQRHGFTEAWIKQE